MKTVYCITDSEYWKLTEGRKAIQQKVYWRNGEHHIKGKWSDTNESFDLPAIFFHDHLPTDKKPDMNNYPKKIFLCAKLRY